MKKALLFTLLLVFAVSLTACGNSPVEKSISKLTSPNSKKISQEDGKTKIMELLDQMQSGEITKDEYLKKSKEIKNNMQPAEEAIKEGNNNISDFKGLPSWAKKVGIIEPEGLTFLPSESNIVKADGNYPDSFTATYEGDKETMMSEGKKITKELGLKVDFDLENVYMSGGEVGDYTVGVSIANNKGNWKFILSASDLSEQGKIKDSRNK